jgi:lycopene beta-cyclase
LKCEITHSIIHTIIQPQSSEQKTPKNDFVTKMTESNEYDIIVAGAGLSGLSFLTELLRHQKWADARILLLDRDDKTTNDRTWCFWATPDEVAGWDGIIHRSWPIIQFLSTEYAAELDTGAYQYHMVRGIDFYDWARTAIAAAPNITWKKTHIEQIDAKNGRVTTTDGVYAGRWVLNSALSPLPLLPHPSGQYERPPISTSTLPYSTLRKPDADTIWLLQHFQGWVIEVPDQAFDPLQATLMDFRIEQAGETRFVYVLPLSSTRALVEFTVFSPVLLAHEVYEEALKSYLTEFLNLRSWQVLDEEFGVIPMTDHGFGGRSDGLVIHIGTVGGMVKGSSGYAFKRTRQRMRQFVDDWAATGSPSVHLLRSPKRFRMYDSIFLRALVSGRVSSQVVFSSFFKKLGGTTVFDFLDEKTSFLTDLKALSSVPTPPFLWSFFRQLRRLWSV